MSIYNVYIVTSIKVKCKGLISFLSHAIYINERSNIVAIAIIARDLGKRITSLKRADDKIKNPKTLVENNKREDLSTPNHGHTSKLFTENIRMFSYSWEAVMV